MATAIKGVNAFLLFRKLSEAQKKEAQRLAYQTEHSRSLTADSSNTVTKDGNVNVPGVAKVEMSVTSVLSQGDTLQEELEQAIVDGSRYEIWEIVRIEDESVLAEGEQTKKYPATYYQGYITSAESNFGAEDLTQLSIGLAIDGVGAKGMATVTEKQSEAIQYAYRDTGKYIPEKEETEVIKANMIKK